MLTVNSPQEVYRDPLYPNKFKAFRFDERMGTYVMVIYVDYGEDGYIRTAYEVSDPWLGVQGWKKVGGLNQ